MENNLIVDDNPTKSVFKPHGTIITFNTWTNYREEAFLVNELAPYLRKFVHYPSSISDFFLSDPIDSGPLCKGRSPSAF